jgi:hypothetical protein
MRPWLLHLPSWRATAPLGRALLVLGALLITVAVGTARTAWQTGITVHREASSTVAPATAALDAGGCPAVTSCALRNGVPAVTRAALSYAFPHAATVLADSTVGSATGRLYRLRLVATVGTGATLELSAQCVPGVPSTDHEYETTSAQQRSDLAGNQIEIMTLRRILVPAGPGCGLSLQLSAPGDGTGYLAAFEALAHDHGAQVQP